ncbi:hypothetical protein QTI33_12250 [Variovorax sp. J22P271]|uniref:hypothetical protein n=1 Tax=Variovorax davisae TaxID=3053515 RepID=UPI0025760147|nr:hypothetical protein [Variovorax sp. J22P271]MDM0032896.1 hypothetical protein [Variovorax sp. J22P271]
MRKLTLRAAAWIFGLASGLAAAQGDGGSQTSCELQFSTCKQTANADYQFCKNASEKNCRVRLNKALQSCSSGQNRCQNATQGRQFSG